MLVRKSSILQHILLYLLLITNGALIYDINLLFVDWSIFLISALILIVNFRRIDSKYYIAIIMFVAGVAFVWFNSGGAGIAVIIKYLGRVMGVVAVYQIDSDYLAVRYYNLVTIFAAISIVAFLLGLILPDFLLNLLSYTSLDGRYKGILFYTAALPLSYFKRNASIFTEPALYSIVLLSALSLFLFKYEQIIMDDKRKIRNCVIISIALLTCMSTTGYLCLGILLVYYALNGKSSYKKNIMRVIIVLLVVVALDYAINGSQSLLNIGLISKITGNSGTIDINATTGKYRTASVMSYLDTFLRNPLGNGYDNTYAILHANNKYGTAAAGGGLIQDLAALGIVSVGALIGLLYSMLKENSKVYGEALIVLIIYIILTTAQSTALYIAFFIYAIVPVSDQAIEDNNNTVGKVWR